MDKTVELGILFGLLVLILVGAAISFYRMRCHHKGTHEYLGQMSGAQAAGAPERYHVFMCTKCAKISYADPDEFERRTFDYARARKIQKAVEIAKQRMKNA